MDLFGERLEERILLNILVQEYRQYFSPFIHVFFYVLQLSFIAFSIEKACIYLPKLTILSSVNNETLPLPFQSHLFYN